MRPCLFPQSPYLQAPRLCRAAARYDAIGDKDAGVAVANFFSTLLRGHSFSTGGSNWLEFWHNPLTLGDAVTSVSTLPSTSVS